MSEPIVQLERITKSFQETKGKSLLILDGIDLTLSENESVAIIGNSGSGKSTLLEICGTLLSPSTGSILFEGKDITSLSDRQLCAIRNGKMGFIFQNCLLLHDFTALENVMMPGLIMGLSRKEAKTNAERLLAMVGLQDRLTHAGDALSGGERQRVAIARALMNHPQVLFADEPTGSLDEENARTVEQMLFSMVEEEKVSLLLVTHNISFARKCGKVYRLHERCLHEE